MKIFNKVFLSALLFPTVSLAGVQVYGILDTAILGQKVKGETATMDFTSGYSMGNRFGFKGQEELGGGYSVGFVAHYHRCLCSLVLHSTTSRQLGEKLNPTVLLDV